MLARCWHVTERHEDKWLFEERVKHYDCPRHFFGPGLGISRHFNQACDEHGSRTLTTASHAAWWHGLVERHGASFGILVQKLCFQRKETGKIAGSTGLAAKS